MAETRAAILLGNGGADPAHARHLLPELLVVAPAVLDHAPRRRHRLPLSEELAPLLEQHLELVGEVEVHRPFLHADSRRFDRHTLSPPPPFRAEELEEM